MPNFHFGGLPLGCNIHLNHWLAFYCIWWERTDLLNVTKSFSSNFSCSHLLAWLGIAYPLLTLYIWAALCQWIIMRPMKFERDIFCFGCLLSGYIAWHTFWTTLLACLFAPVATLVFPLLTAQLKANWRVYKGSSEKGPRIIEEFLQIFNWN